MLGLGFIDGTLEAKHHIINYVYYDIGRLIIQSKEGHGCDSIYIEDFFTVENFIEIVNCLTGLSLYYSKRFYSINH